jgi:putative membrane protein
MKRLTFDAILAATLMLGPAAWAQTVPGGDDTVVKPRPDSPSSTGTVPGPSQKRERNTTPSPTPAPDITNPKVPGPADTTNPHVPTPPVDTNRPDPRGTPTPGTTGTEGTTGTPPRTITDDAAPSNAAAPTAGMAGDLDVVTKVHQANQKEIEMAQMALDKAESAQVKAYARKVLNDHQGADKKLMAYVEKKNLDRSKVEQTATGTAAATPKADEDAHARLLSATGADFDRQFVNMMLDEHDKAIDLVKSAKDSVTDKQLRTFLAGVLPKLEQHRKMARELAEKQSKT